MSFKWQLPGAGGGHQSNVTCRQAASATDLVKCATSGGFWGHALSMASIECKLPRVILLLAQCTDVQQQAALRHFETCVKCGGSLAATLITLRDLNKQATKTIACEGVSAKSLQLAKASSSRQPPPPEAENCKRFPSSTST